MPAVLRTTPELTTGWKSPVADLLDRSKNLRGWLAAALAGISPTDALAAAMHACLGLYGIAFALRLAFAY